MLNLLKRLFGFGNRSAAVSFEQLRAQGAVVIDVRSPAEFAGGHVAGAVNVPLDQLEAQLPQLKAYDKPLIVCCASGTRSGRAKALLERRGVDRLHDAGSWKNLL